jgi:hypothetical protein
MMKGQFFLVGALLFILMFYLGFSLFLSPSHTSPVMGNGISDLFDNIENEYPRALNFGLNVSKPVDTLANFTDFAINITEGRGSHLRAFWLVTENVSDDLNITAGNFLGFSIDVTLNVSGVTKVMYVDNGNTNSSLFTSPPSEFELGLNFNTTEKNLLLEKYKANLYLILEMRKGEDLIVGETKA